MDAEESKDLPDVFRNVTGEGGKRRLGMWDDLIERRIEEARRDGEFDNLPGKGKPLDLKGPYCDSGNWLSLKILKDSGFVTDEVRYRKEIEELKDELKAAKSHAQVKRLVREINALVRKLNTMGTNIRSTDIAPLSVDEVIAGKDG